jgi:hypothetical protein|tara:strand:+ start:559 stop:762 length:204 start_codon:yes stop_codon:yes gene_type:complete
MKKRTINSLKLENNDLKELVNELYEDSCLDDRIKDLKKDSTNHDDDMYLSHLIFLKDRVIETQKQKK